MGKKKSKSPTTSESVDLKRVESDGLSSVSSIVQSTQPSIEKLETLETKTVHKTFYEERSSVLDSNDDDDGYDSTSSTSDVSSNHVVVMGAQKRKKLSFDGFLNLGLIFLLASTLSRIVDNFNEKGLLFPNMDLLYCITDELIARSVVDILFFTIGYNLVIYFNSTLRMIFIPFFSSGSSLLTNTIALLELAIYASATVSYIGLFVMTIYLKRLSLMVNIVMAGTSLIYVMKGYSYFNYVNKRIFSLTLKSDVKEAEKSDDERNLQIPTAPIPFIGEYCYFLVAPTLCFFRKYPMSKTIRVTFILKQTVLLLIGCTIAW